MRWLARRVKLFCRLVVFVNRTAVGSRLNRRPWDTIVVKDGLQIKAGAHRLADFAQSFQLLHRFASISSRPFLQFFEQPHVLDGDHRLVGKGFKQLDLRRGEGAHLDATCAQRSDEFPLLTEGERLKRCASHRRNPTLGNRSARSDVGNVERAMLAHPAKMWRHQY